MAIWAGFGYFGSVFLIGRFGDRSGLSKGRSLVRFFGRTRLSRGRCHWPLAQKFVSRTGGTTTRRPSLPQRDRVFMEVRARVSRCSPQFDVPQVQRAAHLEFEWLRAPLVGPTTWLSELSLPTFSLSRQKWPWVPRTRPGSKGILARRTLLERLLVPWELRLSFDYFDYFELEIRELAGWGNSASEPRH